MAIPAPTAYWRLDEASGNRVDATGNGFTLVQNGTVNGVAGLLNNCADFDNNAANFLSIADNTVFRWAKTTNKALSFRVQFDSVAGVDTVISKWGAAGTDQDWIIYRNGTSLVAGGAQNGAVITIGTVAVSTWYHVVLNMHSDNDFQAYFNNVAGTKTDCGAATVTTHTDMRLGNNSGTNAFDGRVDELYWLDGATLTAGEVSELYNGGVPPAYPFLQAMGFFHFF